MKKLSFFFTILLMNAAMWGFSQTPTQSIRGQVLDKTTRYPLYGANVVIVESKPLIGSVTDADGKFRIENIPVGKISIKVSYMGYSEVLLSNIDLIAAKELVLNIELEETVFTGKEVVIQAKSDRISTVNKMASVSIRSFSVEESLLYAGTRNDISRMASNYAGVKGTDDSRNDIIIRGNTPTGLLWRFDDVDIPNPNHYAAFGTSGGPVNILRNNMLLNSDFITGAFPADYGNALAGVFDLKSINGNSQHHNFFLQIGYSGLEAGAEGPINRKKESSYFVTYRYSIFDWYAKAGIQLGTGNGEPKCQDLFFKINLPNTKIGNISVFGYGGIGNISFLDSRRDTTKERKDLYGTRGWDMENYSNQAVIGISQLYLINKSSYTKLTIASTFHNFYFFKDSVTPGTPNTFLYETNNDLECRLFGSFLFNHKFNARHNIKSGIKATLYHLNLSDSIYNYQRNSYVRHNDYTGYSALFQAFIEWQFRISDALTLNTGVHGQYYGYSGSYSVEPRLGIKWKINPLHELGFGFGMHSQMIPFTIFFNQELLDDGSYRMNNDRLDFSRSIHLVLAYDWNINENTRLKLETYYQYLYDIAVNASIEGSYSLLNEGASFDVRAPENLKSKGTGNNYGVEVTAERFLFKGFYYLGTASVSASKYKGSDKKTRNTAFNGGVNFNLLGGKEFNLDSRKKVAKTKKTITISLKTAFGTGRYYTPIDEPQSYQYQRNIYIDNLAFSENFPNYSRTDFKIAYHLTSKKISLEFSMEISNIFNQKNVLYQAFDKNSGKVYNVYQMGTMLVPQYKIIF